MQHILFIGTDFEQFCRLKTILKEYYCIYSIDLLEGTKQYNRHKQLCLVVINLSVILLDYGPEELLCSLRRARPTPIIALSDSMEDSNVVCLLNAGADQVLAIQTPDEVLAAYMNTLINRYTLLNNIDQEQLSQTTFHIGDFSFDFRRKQVFLKGEQIELSRKEFDLLLFFAQNPDRVLSEEHILERVWHTDKNFHSSISKPINRLRQKIEPDHRVPVYIRSVRGRGYQFSPSSVESCDI